MKNLLIAGNWKSNMVKSEARQWLEEFSEQDFPENAEIVIFAPFTLLDMISAYIKVNDLPVRLGAQDISPFEKGAYTGEINVEQIKEFGDYVLIGHSERRSNFSESDEMVNKKIEMAKAAGLNIVVCVSNLDQVNKLSSRDLVIAYEPIDAIGTGNAEDPKHTSEIASEIKNQTSASVIYGGSVNPENVKKYTGLENINGVLVGSESLHPRSFVSLIRNAV